MKIDEKNYIDITEKYLKNKNIKKGRVEDLLDYEHDGAIYKVDGKKVVLDYSKKEKEVAEWLAKTFGCIVKMVPRVNFPKHIKTSDYLLNEIKFDLKEIIGSSKNSIDNSLKNKKEQANNFIIDISKTKLSINEVIEQIENIYNSQKRNWIDIIILKKNDKLIKVFKRN